MLLTPAVALGYEETLFIDEGRALTSDAAVQLTLTGPDEAAYALVGANPGLIDAVRLPSRGTIDWMLDDRRPDGTQRLFARYFTAEGAPIPALDTSDGIVLDRTAPRSDDLRLAVHEPHLVCRAGGPTVAGTSADRVRARVGGKIADRAGGIEVRFGASRDRPGPWRPRSQARVGGVPGAAIWTQLRDRLGNVGSWRKLTLPATPRARIVRPGAHPFTWARHCARSQPKAQVRRINARWRSSNRGNLRNRDRVQPPGSALVWTHYAGQGLYPNWVHAATELNGILGKSGQRTPYRAGVAEVLAASRRDRSRAGLVYRLNENHFRTPDDNKAPPWRDAMGSALILAHLPTATSTGDGREQAIALDYAEQYLAAFTVSHAQGGLLWRGSRPGNWYLEYTYRTRARVLNGFMQSIVSLDRFERQARRLARRDARWHTLANRARRLAVEGGRALHHWLPAYDLGAGRTRYSLTSGPATEEYRSFHVSLLKKLSAISYLPRRWRARHNVFAARWQQPGIASGTGAGAADPNR